MPVVRSASAEALIDIIAIALIGLAMLLPLADGARQANRSVSQCPNDREPTPAPPDGWPAGTAPSLALSIRDTAAQSNLLRNRHYAGNPVKG